MSYYIGVDVGTASVRAAVVNSKGEVITINTENIQIWNCTTDFYEQSSDDVWRAVTKTVQSAVLDANISKKDVAGLGFDATCSMVVLDENFKPITVSPTGKDEQNIIMWMDHRAEKETAFINAVDHEVTKSVISLEMQPPKLLWLKKNLISTWKSAAHFFDLPDFLTWRATNSLSRSLCSLSCKWTYQSYGWPDDFLTIIGLEDLCLDKHAKIGGTIQDVGSPCGNGLSRDAAEQLGLNPGTPVGTSTLDAYAGAIGCLSCTSKLSESSLPDMDNCLVMIAGTSTCHIIGSKKAVHVPGVWGPYYSALLPDWWNSEGGQSAAGSLIDHITQNHSAYVQSNNKAKERNMHVYEYLFSKIIELSTSANLDDYNKLTEQLHVYPDFHGNRSPLSDSSMKGMVCGLSLSATEDDLALLYLAAVQALAYSTRHIAETMRESGHEIKLVFMCGGLCKNTLYVQTHADVLGLPVALPVNTESVLLGSAMLGACASGNYKNLPDVMKSMAGPSVLINPRNNNKFHTKKYSVFRAMLTDQRKYAEIMHD